MARKQLAVQKQTKSVLDTIFKSIESGNLTPEQLDSVLNAQERILDRQALMDFNSDMVLCQGEMPTILKTAKNSQTDSMYETLDVVNKLISPVYTKYGFAISFGTGRASSENSVCITADLIHRGGYTKAYQYELPVDLAGIKGTTNKTAVHASASTVTYARRYLLKLIFNLTTSNEVDDDGNGATALPFITDEQVGELNNLIDEVGGDKKALCRYFKITELEDLKEHAFKDAVRMLNQKRKKVNV